MKMSIDIDDKLMSKAMLLSPGLTKSEIIEKALRLYVTIESQKRLMNLHGKIKWDDEAFS